MDIVKLAKVVKRKNKWCIQSHKTGKILPGTCYDTKAEATKRLQQIGFWKHKKGALLTALSDVSNEVDKTGLLHMADAITDCIDIVSRNAVDDSAVVRLGKIVNLLQKKSEQELAEQLDALLPEVLSMKSCDCVQDERPERIRRLSALRTYNIVKLWQSKYATGELGPDDFEFAKMKEFEMMLKNGFSLPMPITYKSLPTDADNWWDHFLKRGK